MRFILSITLILYLITIQYSFAQKSELDLKNRIKISKDTSLINAYLDLGKYYYYESGEGDSLIYYGNKALKLSQKLKHVDIEIKSLMYIANGHVIYANSHTNSNSYEKAENRLKQGLSLAIKSKNLKMQAEFYNKFGALYINQGKKLLAIENRIKAAKLSEEISDYTNVSIAYYGISMVYAQDEIVDKQLEYINKSIAIIEKHKEVSPEAQYVIYKVASRQYMFLFEETGTNEYGDLGLKFAQKSLIIAQNNSYESRLPASLSLLSDYYLVKKDYKQAEYYAKQVLDYEQFISDPTKINAFETLSTIHKISNQKRLAYLYLDSLNKLKIKAEPYYGSSISSFTYNTYKYFKDYDLAFIAIEEKLEFDKALKEQDQITAINDLETKYKVELKDAEIKNLNQQQQIDNLEIKNKQVKIKQLTMMLIVAFSFIILILFIAKMIQLKRSRQKNHELKIAYDKQIQLEQELSHVRDEIAQDFHDDLGNKLARISLLSNLISGEVSINDPKIKSKIKQITEDANGLYSGTRDFVFSLKSNSDCIEEVATYLSDFGEDFFKKTNIKFNVEKEISTDVKLPHYWNKQLIYIFKEAMTNALKHSKCNDVILKFQYDENQLSIECIDNGIGINQEDMASSNGLLNMKSRANKIDSKLTILSKKPGTIVRFIGNIKTH